MKMMKPNLQRKKTDFRINRGDVGSQVDLAMELLSEGTIHVRRDIVSHKYERFLEKWSSKWVLWVGTDAAYKRYANERGLYICVYRYSGVDVSLMCTKCFNHFHRSCLEGIKVNMPDVLVISLLIWLCRNKNILVGLIDRFSNLNLYRSNGKRE